MKNTRAVMTITLLALVIFVIVLSLVVLHKTTAIQENAPGAPEDEHAHKFRSILVPPTCTEDGYTKYLCACGYNYIADETPASGHVYVTETTQGIGVKICQTCGETETVERMVQP